jgi:hypothetical protein
MSSAPKSIRFDDHVAQRLHHFVAHHPPATGSATVNRLVDEGLRMDEHPGIFFRDGPAGRRAVVVGGADVWELVRALKDARAAEPKLSERKVRDLVTTNTGASSSMVDDALAYWSAYPDEVDASIADAERIEARELAAAKRARALLDA